MFEFFQIFKNSFQDPISIRLEKKIFRKIKKKVFFMNFLKSCKINRISQFFFELKQSLKHISNHQFLYFPDVPVPLAIPETNAKST